MTADVRAALMAFAFFSAFLLLAAFVSGRSPTRVDIETVALRGQAVPLAILFTRLGRWYVVTPLWLAAVAATWALGGPTVIVALVGASQLLSQGVVVVLKHRFKRVRPDYWLHLQEPDTSCPSGHSVSAIVFYGALALIVATDPMVPRAVASVIVVSFAACVAGLPWSRLSLGAHYLTDVACGLLFGAGWVSALYALALRFGAFA